MDRVGTKAGADHQDTNIEISTDHHGNIRNGVKRNVSLQPAVFNYARHLNIGVPKFLTYFTHATMYLALGGEYNDGSDVDFPEELDSIVDFKVVLLYQTNSRPLLSGSGC